MTQIKYYGVDTGIPISERHVLRVKKSNGQYSAVVMDMHSITVARSDCYANIQDLNDNLCTSTILFLSQNRSWITDMVCERNYQSGNISFVCIFVSRKKTPLARAGGVFLRLLNYLLFVYNRNNSVATNHIKPAALSITDNILTIRSIMCSSFNRKWIPHEESLVISN